MSMQKYLSLLTFAFATSLTSACDELERHDPADIPVHETISFFPNEVSPGQGFVAQIRSNTIDWGNVYSITTDSNAPITICPDFSELYSGVTIGIAVENTAQLNHVVNIVVTMQDGQQFTLEEAFRVTSDAELYGAERAPLNICANGCG